jgi:hypothetical protein
MEMVTLVHQPAPKVGSDPAKRGGHFGTNGQVAARLVVGRIERKRSQVTGARCQAEAPGSNDQIWSSRTSERTNGTVSDCD